METNNHATLQRAINGDAEAVAELLSLHGPVVRRTVRARIPSRFQSLLDEDDVMQETYAEAFLDIAGFDCDGNGSFEAWLTRMAKNNLLDAIKGLNADRREGNHHRVTDHNGDGLLALLSGDGTTPSQGAWRREFRVVLEKALEQLPETYRQVVRLYDLEGQNAASVAGRLGCTPGAVFMRRARAHRTLRQILGTFSRYA